MLYKALGFAVWKLGMRYVRRNYGRQMRGAAALGLLGVAGAAAYAATRSGE